MDRHWHQERGGGHDGRVGDDEISAPHGKKFVGGYSLPSSGGVCRVFCLRSLWLFCWVWDVERL